MHIPKSVAIIIIVVVVIFLICVGIWVGVRMNGGGGVSNSASLSPYSAVYLSTGDVYYGLLEWSPSPHMEDAWFLQRGTNAQGQATAGVYPFSQVAWGPAGDVYFNAQDIVFWTRLSATSSVAEAIANPAAAAAAAQQQGGTATQLPAPSTSTPTSSPSK